MEYVNLGKIAKIKTGKLDANAANKNGKYPFFTCSKEPLTINTYSYDCECVLVAGNGDLNVKYYNGKFDAYQRTYIIEILDKNKYNTKYIYLLLISYINALRSKAVGGVIKYIKLGNLTSLKVPMIDIIEQEKIVKKLFKLDKVINIKVLQLKTCDNLIKSQFVEMFGTNKKTKYPFDSLNNLSLKITDGKHGGCNGEENSGYYFVGATEIYNDKINYQTAKEITQNDFEKDYKRCDLKNNDFVIVNTGATIGKSAIVNSSLSNHTLLQKSVALIRPKQELISPIYLKYCYDANPDMYNKGNGCARINLLLSQIKETMIPVPPLELQNKFADIVKQIDKQKFVIENSLENIGKLVDLW